MAAVGRRSADGGGSKERRVSWKKGSPSPGEGVDALALAAAARRGPPVKRPFPPQPPQGGYPRPIQPGPRRASRRASALSCGSADSPEPDGPEKYGTGLGMAAMPMFSPRPPGIRRKYTAAPLAGAAPPSRPAPPLPWDGATPPHPRWNPVIVPARPSQDFGGVAPPISLQAGEVAAEDSERAAAGTAPSQPDEPPPTQPWAAREWDGSQFLGTPAARDIGGAPPPLKVGRPNAGIPVQLVDRSPREVPRVERSRRRMRRDLQRRARRRRAAAAAAGAAAFSPITASTACCGSPAELSSTAAEGGPGYSPAGPSASDAFSGATGGAGSSARRRRLPALKHGSGFRRWRDSARTRIPYGCRRPRRGVPDIASERDEVVALPPLPPGSASRPHTSSTGSASSSGGGAAA